jgi:hypothetical protein
MEEYIETNWEKVGTSGAPLLFWRGAKGALLGYVRDGELFDQKWIYVCDANKVTHFSEVNGPESNVVRLDEERANKAD